jgi:hypothetical protein
MATVRLRHLALVVGPAMRPDRPAVRGTLCCRPLHGGPAPAHRPVVQPRLQRGPAGSPGDLARVACAALRHLLRTAGHRRSRRPSPRPSVSCKWKWTLSDSRRSPPSRRGRGSFACLLLLLDLNQQPFDCWSGMVRSYAFSYALLALAAAHLARGEDTPISETPSGPVTDVRSAT